MWPRRASKANVGRSPIYLTDGSGWHAAAVTPPINRQHPLCVFVSPSSPRLEHTYRDFFTLFISLNKMSKLLITLHKSTSTPHALILGK